MTDRRTNLRAGTTSGGQTPPAGREDKPSSQFAERPINGVVITYDRLMATTGNVFIEVLERRTPEDTDWTPSGLDDFAWYFIGDTECFVFRRERLRTARRDGRPLVINGLKDRQRASLHTPGSPRPCLRHVCVGRRRALAEAEGRGRPLGVLNAYPLRRQKEDS